MPEGERRCPSCERTFEAGVSFCPNDGAALVPRGESAVDPYVGLSILGQIEIKELCGAGSMARVYRAFQHGVERDVAVKILHRELSANAEVVQRFHREAKLASRLQHPNVVNVLLTAQLPNEGKEAGGELVLVMEYLDGLSLFSALEAAGGAIPLPRALHVILQVCDAVGEAHALGMVHRDIKPENIMLVRRGDDRDFVKVLDFGLARLSVHEASYATRAGAIFGSPRYISPEGAQGLPVGPPADVYGIATVLYQCLAGRTPFEADSPVGFLLAHTNEPAPRLATQTRAAYVPAPIAEVIDRGLAKRPDDRYPDARAFGRALASAARRANVLGDALAHPSFRSSLAPITSIPSLARTRVGSGTEILEPKTTSGTLAAPLDPLPLVAPSSGVAPTLFDAPIAVSRTEMHEPHPVPPPGVAPETLQWRPPVGPTIPGSRPSWPSPAPLKSHPPSSAPSQPTASPDPPLAPHPAASVPLSVPPHAASLSPAHLASIPPHAFPPSPPGSIATSIPSPVHPSLPPAPRGTMPGAALPTAPPGDITRRSPWTTAALVAMCFACGAAVAAASARRFGFFQPKPQLSRADAILAEANEAESREDWDAPPQRNVRDLLARGRSEFPSDERFAVAQHRASLDLTLQAVKERSAGHVDEARHLARVALDIDPENRAAEAIVRDLSPPPPVVSVPEPVPTPASSSHASSKAHPTAPPHPIAPPSAKPAASASDDAPDGGRWL